MAAAGDDAQIKKSDTSWPPGGSADLTQDGGGAVFALLDKNGATYSLGEFCLRWDTSSIPDGDVVSAATLTMAALVRTEDLVGRVAIGEWFDFVTLDAGDYTATPGSDAFVDPTDLNSFGNSPLALLNPSSHINKAGYTGIRVGIREGGVPPIDRCYVAIAGYEYNGVTDSALLTVTHDPPAQGGSGLMLGGVG